jgi:hypothetical protein
MTYGAIALGKRFYSPEQNGLRQDWYQDSNSGVVWCNPPYRWQVLGEWVRKGAVTLVAGFSGIFCIENHAFYAFQRHSQHVSTELPPVLAPSGAEITAFSCYQRDCTRSKGVYGSESRLSGYLYASAVAEIPLVLRDRIASC